MADFDDIGDDFFIHHASRTTTWEDPRPRYYAQRSPGPSPQPQRSPRPATRPAESIQMQMLSRPKCKTCQIKEVSRAGLDCYDCQAKEKQRQIALQRAKEAAQEEVRRRESQQKVSKLQKQRRIQSAKRRGQTLKFSDSEDSDRETSFSNQPKPSSQEPEPKRQVTAAEKTTMKLNLKAKYPKHPEFLIEMALEASGYDREKTELVLGAAKSPQISKKDKGPSAGSSRQATPSDVQVKIPASTSAVVFEQSESTKAVVFGADDYSSSSSSSSSSEDDVVSGQTVSARMSALSKPTSPKKTVNITVVTQPRARPMHTTRTKPIVVTYGSSSGSYKSLLCCKPQGPDSSLVKGPSRENLISSYAEALGPNPEYRYGPDPDNVAGPMKRSTVKQSQLACGPQASLYNGPQHYVAMGTTL
ncbi:uncharacterized protein [Ptychodera flava]|uniref:uncharacterized protein isoform X2 n=1 Tax=Ptychodera flava TaxID=63121 RepID=UPI003969C7D1